MKNTKTKNTYKIGKKSASLSIAHRDGNITIGLDKEALPLLQKYSWYARTDHGTPIAFTKITKQGKTKELLLHRYLYSKSIRKQYAKMRSRLTHKNGNTLNCRSNNIIECKGSARK